MKRKYINDEVKVNGLYIREFNKGFFGEHKEGEHLLRKMGLPIDTIPFSTAKFLHTKHIFWLDSQGHRATISFKYKTDQLECYGVYLGKRKSLRLFLEWNTYEDPEMIAKLESETIGELCMKCIYENIE